MNTKHMFLILILICCSCAGYKPVVDTAQIEDMDKYDRDEWECENLAHENSNTGNATVAGAGIGAALGAGVGALIGAIFGDAGEGAAFGAVVGGTQGAISGGASEEQKYRQIFAGCMAGRGYNVLY
jgi:hypothetical protein